MEKWRQTFQEVLEKRFTEIRGKNPRFSISAYARMTKISAPAMSQLLRRSDKLKITPIRAVEICELIGTSPALINRILVLAGEKPKYQVSAFPEKDYEILTEWDYLAVLFSYDLSPPLSFEEKAKRLGISDQRLSAISENLLQRGLLKKGENGQLTREQDKKYITSDNIPNGIIKRHHLSNLDAISKSIEILPVEKRDITSMTFTGDAAKLDRVRTEIREFYQKIFAIMDDGENRDEVFKIVVGIAPMNFSNDEKRAE